MITIVEPNLVNGLEHVDARYRAEPATETRKKLRELFRVDEPDEVQTVPVLSKEQPKAIKEKVYAKADALFNIPEIFHYSEDIDEFAQAERSTVVAYSSVYNAAAAAFKYDGEDAQEATYYMQYAVAWAKAKLHTLGTPKITEKGFLLGLVYYPMNTSDYFDEMARIAGCTNRGLLYPQYPQGALAKFTARYIISDVCGYSSCHHVGAMHYSQLLGMVYTAEDSAWFAGFLNEDDCVNLRFRRMRIGAAVKELTGSDEQARTASEKQRSVNSFNFVLHPNDVPWGAEYIRMQEEGQGLLSCMSQPEYDYNCPHDVHPCDTYSSAHFGSGDNGLVLVEAQTNGVPVGRGILNVHTKQIVRWYGKYNARVQLSNKYGIQTDADALSKSWLALIDNDDRFAGPYIDGSYDCGDMCTSEGRVYLGTSGHTLSETDGYYYDGDRQQCCIDGEYYHEDAMQYQEYNNTWYHPDNIGDYGAKYCPVTGEYFHDDTGYWLTIDGEEVRVSWAGYHRIDTHDYTNLGGDIGYTLDIEQYRLLANGDWVQQDDAYYDEETDDWYTEEEHAELLADREAQEEEQNAA